MGALDGTRRRGLSARHEVMTRAASLPATPKVGARCGYEGLDARRSSRPSDCFVGQAEETKTSATSRITLPAKICYFLQNERAHFRHSDRTCGVTARDRLADHIGGRAIDCAATGKDVYGRILAVCRSAGEDLNAWMVREGWALAFVRYSKAYAADETAANEAQRGLWSGAFIAPWDWLHRGRKTIIRGSLAVPLDAQSKLLTPRSAISSAVAGLHHQGQHQPQGRAHLSHARRTRLREGQHDRSSETLVLHGG